MRIRNADARTWFCVALAFLVSAWVTEAAAQKPELLVPRAALKLIIEHPSLAQYLDPEATGREILLVSDHLLKPGVTPSRFGKPVQIVADGDVGSQPHIRFLSFETNGSSATAVMEYKVEGVRAKFVLEQSSIGWWTVVDAQVAEH